MWHSVVKGVYYCGLVIFVFCANKCFKLREELSFLQGIHFCNFHKVVDGLLTAFSFFINFSECPC